MHVCSLFISLLGPDKLDRLLIVPLPSFFSFLSAWNKLWWRRLFPGIHQV
jgi:hypothetical protein